MMLCINYKMETNNLIISHSLEYIDGKLIDILDIDLDYLKIDKKKQEDFTIYYFNHINKNKKPTDSTNELYLSIKGNSGCILKENDENLLIIDYNNLESNHYYLLLSRLRNHIPSEYGRKGQFISFNDDYKKNKFLTDDNSIPDEFLYFNEKIIVIKFIFKQEYILYPQIYLESVDYKLYE